MLRDRREAYFLSLLQQACPRHAHYGFASMRAGLGLVFTCDIPQVVVSAHFASNGLSRSTSNTLMLLRHGPAERIQSHKVGELLLVDRVYMTGLIDDLTLKKFVTPTVEIAGWRACFAWITPAVNHGSGEALPDALVPAHQQTLRALLQEMTPDEKRAWSN